MTIDGAVRGSGRRRRSKFDPYSWTQSIPPRRNNVLCLGVSYPCVRSQLKAAELSSSLQLLHPQECVEQAVELVRRNVLTEMDGRDLARCLALEASNETFAYTVSMEHGATYGPRHLTANFNRHGFCREIKKAWSTKIKFRQIILDYFWIPAGSWTMTHWARTFFTTTLPSFVTENLLDLDSEEGIVYLPFCLHCMAQLVAAEDILSKYYDISFLYKHELSQHALWLATSSISPQAMQTWLGKDIKQEEIYCTFTLQDVLNGVMDDAYVRKEDVLKILRGIEDFDNVRMIKMKGRQRTKQNKTKKSQVTGENEANFSFENVSALQSKKGGFIALKNPKDVINGINNPGGTKAFSASKRKEKEQPSNISTDSEPIKDSYVLDDEKVKRVPSTKKKQKSSRISKVSESQDGDTTSLSTVNDEFSKILKISKKSSFKAEVKNKSKKQKRKEKKKKTRSQTINTIDAKSKNDEPHIIPDCKTSKVPQKNAEERTRVVKTRKSEKKKINADHTSIASSSICLSPGEDLQEFKVANKDIIISSNESTDNLNLNEDSDDSTENMTSQISRPNATYRTTVVKNRSSRPKIWDGPPFSDLYSKRNQSQYQIPGNYVSKESMARSIREIVKKMKRDLHFQKIVSETNTPNRHNPMSLKSQQKLDQLKNQSPCMDLYVWKDKGEIDSKQCFEKAIDRPSTDISANKISISSSEDSVSKSVVGDGSKNSKIEYIKNRTNEISPMKSKEQSTSSILTNVENPVEERVTRAAHILVQLKCDEHISTKLKSDENHTQDRGKKVRQRLPQKPQPKKKRKVGGKSSEALASKTAKFISKREDKFYGGVIHAPLKKRKPTKIPIPGTRNDTQPTKTNAVKGNIKRIEKTGKNKRKQTTYKNKMNSESKNSRTTNKFIAQLGEQGKNHTLHKKKSTTHISFTHHQPITTDIKGKMKFDIPKARNNDKSTRLLNGKDENRTLNKTNNISTVSFNQSAHSLHKKKSVINSCPTHYRPITAGVKGKKKSEIQTTSTNNDFTRSMYWEGKNSTFNEKKNSSPVSSNQGTHRHFTTKIINKKKTGVQITNVDNKFTVKRKNTTSMRQKITSPILTQDAYRSIVRKVNNDINTQNKRITSESNHYSYRDERCTKETRANCDRNTTLTISSELIERNKSTSKSRETLEGLSADYKNASACTHLASHFTHHSYLKNMSSCALNTERLLNHQYFDDVAAVLPMYIPAHETTNIQDIYSRREPSICQLNGLASPLYTTTQRLPSPSMEYIILPKQQSVNLSSLPTFSPDILLHSDSVDRYPFY